MPQTSIKRSTTHVMTLAFSASLLGISQNGLLTLMPVLISQSGVPLSHWALLLTIGTLLFLPGSPYWGRQCDERGRKSVLLSALVGIGVSGCLMVSAVYWLSTNTITLPIGLGIIAVARVIYGLTASGLVPSAQSWAIATKGADQKVKAIAYISAGLSSGRLLGPLLTLGLLNISVYVALLVVPILALLSGCLVMMIKEPIETSASVATKRPAQRLFHLYRLPVPLLCVLGIALLLAGSVALMQLGLTPKLHALLSLSDEEVSRYIGLLMTVSASATLITQVGIIKIRKPAASALFFVALPLLVVGYFILPMSLSLPSMFVGIILMSVGAALVVPAYTSIASDFFPDRQGQSAGYIAMSHTLGYGVAAGLVTLSSHWHPAGPLWTCFMMALLMSALYGIHRLLKGHLVGNLTG